MRRVMQFSLKAFLTGALLFAATLAAPPSSAAATTADCYELLTSTLANHVMITKIDTAIASAIARGRQPVVAMDLDDTLFFHAIRITALLKQFDAENGSNFFENLHYSEVPSESSASLKGFLRSRLNRKNADRVAQYVLKARRTPEATIYDKPNPLTAALAIRWKKAGATIVYITGRLVEDDAITRQVIEREGLPLDSLTLRPLKINPIPEFKVRALAEYLAAHPEAVAVAFLDDDGENVQAIHVAMPSVLVYRAKLSRDPGNQVIHTRFVRARH
jgi:hypothetical protein